MDENNLSVSCNNKKLIFSKRFLCFDNNSIEISYCFDKMTTLKLKLNFKYNDDKSPDFKVESQGPSYIIDIYNFNDPIGTGLKSPFELGKYKNKSVFIIFFISKFKESNPILDVALYMED